MLPCLFFHKWMKLCSYLIYLSFKLLITINPSLSTVGLEWVLALVWFLSPGNQNRFVYAMCWFKITKLLYQQMHKNKTMTGGSLNLNPNSLTWFTIPICETSGLGFDSSSEFDYFFGRSKYQKPFFDSWKMLDLFSDDPKID